MDLNQNYIEPRSSMSDKAWDSYCKHLEKISFYEQQKVEAEKVRLSNYKQTLIADILKLSKDYSAESLSKKSIQALERIYDFC